MRKARLVGRTVILRLRFDDFSRATRSRTLWDPTTSTDAILRTARELLTDALPMLDRRGLTLLGISVSNLENADAVQLSLPLKGSQFAELDSALDPVRERFGSKAITRGVLVGRAAGMEVPLLPD